MKSKIKWEKTNQNYEVEKWVQSVNQSVKVQIRIIYIQNSLILYSLDGEILRREQVIDNQDTDNLLNIEQIKKVQWLGIYSKDKKRNGKWKAFWDGEAIVGVGGYSQKSEKSYTIGMDQNRVYGKISTLIIGSRLQQNNKNSEAQIYCIGEYCNDLKNGTWKYIYENKKIGGGLYNVSGQKNGKWIELSEGFQNNSQVTYNGEYDKKGKKAGNWNIFWNYNENNQQIGGGQYDVKNSIKIGRWIELSEGFSHNSQVIYCGQYNKNGNKVGRWEIWYKKNYGDFQNEQIGGGQYDEKGSIKIGRWIEFSNYFRLESEIIYIGEYDNDGKKTGRWNIYQNHYEQNQQIGGGLYHQEGSLKIGKWIELNDGFCYKSQVTYIGEYDKDGKKIGRWEIWYKKNYGDFQNEQIGGGSYNEGGTLKIGRWIELSHYFRVESEITLIGEYNGDGEKIGRWDIWFKNDYGNYKNQQIGGGSYDDSFKTGQWIELSDEFRSASQVILNGQYTKKGQKFGRWDTWYRWNSEESFEKIGGGSYDENYSIKIGKWVELRYSFRGASQVIYEGQYNKNGKKVGRWDFWFRGCRDEPFEKVGGGSYNENHSIKIGQWIELSDGFMGASQVIYGGQYNKNGQKAGQWDILYRQSSYRPFERIGGGLYNYYSIKIGRWIELNDQFTEYNQITYSGEYNKHGQKIGVWVENHKQKKKESKK